MVKKIKPKAIKFVISQIERLQELFNYFNDKKNFYENDDILDLLADILNRSRELYEISVKDSSFGIQLHNGIEALQDLQEKYVIDKEVILGMALKICDEGAASLKKAVDILEGKDISPQKLSSVFS